MIEMVPEEMQNGVMGIAKLNRQRLILRDGASLLLDLSLSLLSQHNPLSLLLSTLSCLSSWRSLVWSHNFPFDLSFSFSLDLSFNMRERLTRRKEDMWITGFGML